MSHKLKVGQAVVQSFRGLDRSVTYQIMQLMPPSANGEPQYLIQCRFKGQRRVVCEAEVKAAFPSPSLEKQHACEHRSQSVALLSTLYGSSPADAGSTHMELDAR